MIIWRNIEKIIKEQTAILKEMTSLSSTIQKTGKKTTSNPTITMTSPATKKSTEGISKTEKPAATPTLLTVHTTLTMIQETMMAMQEKMTTNHTELKTDMLGLDQKMDVIQASILKNEKRIEKVEARLDQNEKKLEAVDQTLTAQNRDLEDSMIQLEMDRASYYLRFQNIVEEREEDLGELMAELIADVLQRDKEEIVREIDEIYRVQTNYARRNKLPREVHVRFARKRVRDILYNMTRDEQITYRGKEIIILKQIPRRVREVRKSYRFLAVQLNKRSILFKWLLPEGMLITWRGKKIKIDSLSVAQDFLDQLRGEEEEQSSKEETETINLEGEAVNQTSTTERPTEERKTEEENIDKKGRPVRAVRLK